MVGIFTAKAIWYIYVAYLLHHIVAFNASGGARHSNELTSDEIQRKLWERVIQCLCSLIV